MTRRATPESARKRAIAAQLRAEGLSWAKVAEGSGYATGHAACEAVKRHRADQPPEADETARRQEVGELATMDQILDQLLNGKLYKVAPSGKVVLDPEDLTPIVDQDAVLAIINARLAVGKERRKLLGLDAPSRTQTSVELTQVELPAHVRKALDRAGDPE